MNSNLYSINPSMSFSVRRFSESFVTPCEPTPCKTLQLSSMDTPKKFLVDTLLVFKHGIEPAKIIRQALSKALVPYYPVTGEFSFSEQGEMEVACTARGVWFVEASSNHTLDEFDYFECPYTIPKNHLLPPSPPQIIDPTTDVFIMLQVTHFKCDGFVVGLRFNHVMFDGVGVGQFMQAIGEMARDHEGGTKLKIEPVWNRDEMPKVPQRVPNFHSLANLVSMEKKTMGISLDHINQLKNKFSEQTAKRCSTFEVIVAKIMRSRLRAIKADLDVQVQLVFPINLRNKCLHNVMPRGGYYGNFLYMKEVEARCWEIVDGSFSDVVELIQDAKRGVSDEFNAWVDGGCRAKDVFINYEKLMVNDWSKIGLESVDYGWGVPQRVIPVVGGPSLVPACMITASSQGGKKCIHLMTNCVKKEHLDAFLDEMMNTDVDVV